ncbi:MAG: glycine betaine ABC transporter substrate-binding protein [Spirochaetales bacterium]
MKRFVLTAFLLVFASGFASAGGQQEGERVRVGGQTINESIVLAHIAEVMISEHTDLDTTINTEFSGSSVMHQAMAGDELDVYPSWTGTQLSGILRYEGENLPGTEAYETVKSGFEEEFNMTWSEPLGFNNTYVHAVPRETAEEHGLEKDSDLAGVASNWAVAAEENYNIRPDAYPGWSEHYDIEYGDLVTMQHSLIYQAIEEGEVDAIVAFATDARIAQFDLVTLEDDLEYFPDYSGAFILRGEFLDEHPEVLEVLNRLGDRIDDRTMRELNRRYDAGEEPEDVARDFLTDADLI